MGKLKVIGKDGKTDITNTIDPKLLKEWEEQADRTSKQLKEAQEYQAKKKHNHLYILKNLMI